MTDLKAALTDDLCDDCPPVGYPTDKTRCGPCPRQSPGEGQGATPEDASGMPKDSLPPDVKAAVERIEYDIGVADEKARYQGEDSSRWTATQTADLRTLLASHTALTEANERLRAGLEPFAKFRLEGFDGEVLEVVPSDPDNPARRIEPIWTSHFRRARALLARQAIGEGENG